MKIHTELFGGAADGKPIELNNSSIPMEIRVPIAPHITIESLEEGNPTEPFSFQTLSYKLNKDGKYWIEKELK